MTLGSPDETHQPDIPARAVRALGEAPTVGNLQLADTPAHDRALGQSRTAPPTPRPGHTDRPRAIPGTGGAAPPWRLWPTESLPVYTDDQAIQADRPVTVEQADELARAIVQDFLEQATRLFHADGAAVTLCHDLRLRPAVASDGGSRAFALAQASLGEGPCLAAVRGERAVPVEDLRADPRWRRLAAVAAAHGVRAILAAPVVAQRRPIGAYSLTTATPRTWSDHEVLAALAAARTLGSMLEVSTAARATAALAAQLQRALDARTVIERAKGVLIERRDLSAEAAFELLRTAARSSRRRVVDVAADVLAGRAIRGHHP
jgi:hypothetical protein